MTAKLPACSHHTAARNYFDIFFENAISFFTKIEDLNVQSISITLYYRISQKIYRDMNTLFDTLRSLKTLLDKKTKSNNFKNCEV